MINPIIVAHRGLPELYPENTVLSIEQAILCGAKAVEFDVQITADKIPVVFHDIDLKRISGQKGLIPKMTWAELQRFKAYYPKRFSDKFADTPISSLTEVTELFTKYPKVIPCIEIKPESIGWFDVKSCVQAIINTIHPILKQAILISYSEEVISYLHNKRIKQTGWILQHYDKKSLDIAESLKPKILVCNMDKMPIAKKPLWQGEWEWMVYQTEDPLIVQRCIDHGIHYIETDNIKKIASALPEYFDDFSGHA